MDPPSPRIGNEILGGFDETSRNMIDDEDDTDDCAEEVWGSASGLKAYEMIYKGSPTQHQAVLKLHVPFVYQVLPRSLQKWVFSSDCLSKQKWLVPKWRIRYMVLLGNYLYRFKSDNSTSPKGSPILVQHTKARVVNINDGDDAEDQDAGVRHALEGMPVGSQGVFAVHVQGSGKTQYYGVTTVEDARAWVNSLRQSKQESIVQSLGHSKLPPNKQWEYYNSLGDRFLERKARIKSRLEAYNSRDFEMTALAAGSAPMHTSGIYT